LTRKLNADGYALTDPVLLPGECQALIDTYGDDTRFRKRIVMERYRYGVGDYAYFAYPFPALVQELRESLYAHLAPIANEWKRQLSRKGESTEWFPDSIAEYLDRCHAAGQLRPTPLLLKYEASGYNCLHQDLYGAIAFPFQAVCFLSQPGRDYTGGEFLLVEQRPRAQSAGQVIQAKQGEALLFTTRFRPVKGSRGYYRANVKHGVSKIHGGERYTLGVIFHDAV